MYKKPEDELLNKKDVRVLKPACSHTFGGGGVRLEACCNEWFRSLGAYKFRRSLKELLLPHFGRSLAPCGRGLGRGVNFLSICRANTSFESNLLLSSLINQQSIRPQPFSTKNATLNAKRGTLPLLTGEGRGEVSIIIQKDYCWVSPNLLFLTLF